VAQTESERMACGLGGGALHLMWQLRTVDLKNGKDCMNKFVSNKWFGAIVFTGIVLDSALS